VAVKQAKHISRQELKTNQVQDLLSHSAEAVLAHKMTVVYVVIAVLVVAGGIFGWRFYAQRQTVKAEAAFNDAMRIYSAPVVAAGQPPQPNVTTYSNDAQKYQAALAKFQSVAGQYPQTRPGQLALYYEALCETHLGQNVQAITTLTTLEKSSNRDFASMAKFELAQIYDQTGKPQQAVQLYNQLLQNSSVLVPKPIVLLALAAHYQQSDPAQAVRLYQQIKRDYPDTTAADQATQQLSLLPSGKS